MNEHQMAFQRDLHRRWPHWRHFLLRMLLGLLLLGLAFLGVLAAQRLGLDPSMSSAPLLLVIALVALFWGTKQALLMLLVSLVLLDYLALPPLGTFHLPTGKEFVQLLPFLLSGGIIAILTAQRERARSQAQQAEQASERYADEVEQDTILRNIALVRAAQGLCQRVEEWRADTTVSSNQLNPPEASHPHHEQIDTFQELLTDLPSLNTIRSAQTFFRLLPYDLRTICQGVVENLPHSDGRVIACESSSSPILIERDADHGCFRCMHSSLGKCYK